MGAEGTSEDHVFLAMKKRRRRRVGTVSVGCRRTHGEADSWFAFEQSLLRFLSQFEVCRVRTRRNKEVREAVDFIRVVNHPQKSR